MEITKLWQPYNIELHKELKIMMHFSPDDKFLITLNIRNSEGKILKEYKLNEGEIITGKTSLLLDFSFIFEKEMQKSVKGLVGATFVSDKCYTGEAGCYYLTNKGFTYVTSTPLPKINNNPNKSGRYRGFSVHLVDEAIKNTGLVLINISTNPNYDKSANYLYEIVDKTGKTIKKDAITIPPFGTAWIDVDISNLIKRKQKMYTMFGNCDESSMISFLYTVMKNGCIGVDHTQPPLTQIMYGADTNSNLKGIYLKLKEKINRKIRYKLNYFEEGSLKSLLWKKIGF